MANLEGSLPVRCEGGPCFFPAAGPLVGERRREVAGCVQGAVDGEEEG